MKKILTIRDKSFLICVTCILFISILFRFTNYENRWGLAYDQSYDAVVARYALINHKIPLLGRFSSAGPFQTGGEWFWLIMAGMALNPESVLSPWIFLTLLYVLFVLLMILFSKELVDKEFAIISGILTALSTAQIAQGVNLTNQSPQAFISLIMLWYTIRYLRNKKLSNLFISAICVGLASSIHLQGTALILLLIISIILNGVYTIRTFLTAVIGILIPWLPVFVVDFNNNFFNINNMFRYYMYDQYKISLDVIGRRWLSYLGIFWPQSWAVITGGYSLIIYIFAPLSILYLIYKNKNRTIVKEWFLIIGGFTLILCLLRYIRTPLFDSYLVFTHPLVLLITAGIIYKIKKYHTVLGYFILVILIAGSVFRSINEVYSASNQTSRNVKELQNNLYKEFGDNNFVVYDYKYANSSVSLPFVLFLYTDNKISDKGQKIGIINCNEVINKNKSDEITSLWGICLVNLDYYDDAELSDLGWVLTNPSRVYFETQEWYRNENNK